MRPCDLDTSGDVWWYTPRSHKTEHHGHQRVIALGPRAQDVVRPFLKPSLEAYLFSPKEAVEHWHREKRRDEDLPRLGACAWLHQVLPSRMRPSDTRFKYPASTR